VRHCYVRLFWAWIVEYSNGVLCSKCFGLYTYSLLCLISATLFPLCKTIGALSVMDSDDPEELEFLHSSSISVFKMVPLLFATRRYVPESSKLWDNIPLVVVMNIWVLMISFCSSKECP